MTVAVPQDDVQGDGPEIKTYLWGFLNLENVSTIFYLEQCTIPGIPAIHNSEDRVRQL